MSSCPCPNKDRACKSTKYLDGSSIDYQQIIPNRDVADASFGRGIIQFDINVPEGSFWDPRRSFMEFVVYVDNWAGGVVANDITWAKNAGACFFESMTLLFKGHEVFSIPNDLAITDTVYKRLTYRTHGPHDYTAEDVDNAVMFDKGENVSELITKFCWKLPVIEDMGKIPPGNYTVQLQPSANLAQRVLKMPLSTDAADIDYAAAGQTHSVRVQVKKLKYWVHTTRLSCGAPPVPLDVRVPMTISTVYDLLTMSGSMRINARPRSTTLVFGYVDSRRNIDARIETTDLKFYLAEALGVIPPDDQSQYLDTFQAEVRSVSKPNPQFKLYDPNSDSMERDLYMYSRGNRVWPITMEAFNKFEDDGSYIMIQFAPQEGASELGSVRYSFDNAGNIDFGQLVVFELLDTRFLFDVDANACVLVSREA